MIYNYEGFKLIKDPEGFLEKILESETKIEVHEQAFVILYQIKSVQSFKVIHKYKGSDEHEKLMSSCKAIDCSHFVESDVACCTNLHCESTGVVQRLENHKVLVVNGPPAVSYTHLRAHRDS